jgi:N utilization substance protein A
VEIKIIAREAGARSKVAVAARESGVDPVGACVGIRGVRVQNVVSELGGEKVDIVPWSPDAGALVANALSPARVTSVTILKDENTAVVVVPDDQLSLAIGRGGQNARLSARLTGWRIDIKSVSEAREDEEWMTMDGEGVEFVEEGPLEPGAAYEEIIEYVEEIVPEAAAQPQAVQPEVGESEVAAAEITVEKAAEEETPAEAKPVPVPGMDYALPQAIEYAPVEVEPEEEGEIKRVDGKRKKRSKRRRSESRGPGDESGDWHPD